ncbi:hypothetical protein TGMAS_244165 [Toxoplasma gondii MAS]|uniref:Uncharacterized protein n=1 Tax=Toxoplasma gondii MAS TaxID=943118 RepID=A0A086QNC9_TOXGO|nr:hypothetical protein TGMAS_244165 [Toxoplasma gondii MAS]
MAGCSPASGFVAFFASRSSPSDVSSFLHQDEKRALASFFLFLLPSACTFAKQSICAPRFFRLWTKARAVTKTLLSDASLPNFQAVMLLRHLMRSDNCSHQVLPGFLLVLASFDWRFSLHYSSHVRAPQAMHIFVHFSDGASDFFLASLKDCDCTFSATV